MAILCSATGVNSLGWLPSVPPLVPFIVLSFLQLLRLLQLLNDLSAPFALVCPPDCVLDPDPPPLRPWPPDVLLRPAPGRPDRLLLEDEVTAIVPRLGMLNL